MYAIRSESLNSASSVLIDECIDAHSERYNKHRTKIS